MIKYKRTKTKTIFTTRNEQFLREILTKARIGKFDFIKDASPTTTHLNKRLTDEQVKRYKHYLAKTIKNEPQSKDLGTIRGFKGCLINGFEWI